MFLKQNRSVSSEGFLRICYYRERFKIHPYFSCCIRSDTEGLRRHHSDNVTDKSNPIGSE